MKTSLVISIALLAVFTISGTYSFIFTINNTIMANWRRTYNSYNLETP